MGNEHDDIATNLLDAVSSHELYKSGDAGGVLVSEHIFMCLENFKRSYGSGGMELGQTINGIYHLPLGTIADYKDDEWHILTKEEWLGAMIDGTLEYFDVEPPQ